MKNLHFIGTYLLILFTFMYGCSGTEQVIVERQIHDTQTQYMSATGSDHMREEIKKGLDSTKRLHNTAVYRTYLFNLNDLPTRIELNETEFDDRAVQTQVDYESKAGSALILRNSGGTSAILTASHTVTFPDTLWHFVEVTDNEMHNHVEAVSVREGVSHFLIGSQGVYDFEILVNDPARDLAIMAHRWDPGERPGLSTLQLQAGWTDDLDWTDQVYAVGYPKGVEMVTRAMVSKSMQSQRRNFVLDAAFNRGFSGGAVFAERGDGTGMDWVGMISSASAERIEFLAPQRSDDEDFRPNLEYTGSVYTQRMQQINYGITYAIGIDQIRDFYTENRNELRRRGVLLSVFE